jgi:CRP/FNR family cyclic AMP-dependent transcriptional regulator
MDLAGKVALLRTCPLFEKLPATDLEQLAQQTSLRRYRRGQIVFHEGDPGDSLLVVADGRLKVVTNSDDGDQLLLAVVGPPESIGALTLADGGRRSATVEPLTDVVVLRVDRADIMGLPAARTAVAEALVQMLALAVRRLTGTAADLVFLDLPRRLAKLLLEQRRVAGADVVDLPWTQTDMASSVGASRQGVNATLGDFQRRGWIAADGHVLRILDPVALARFAGS